MDVVTEETHAVRGGEAQEGAPAGSGDAFAAGEDAGAGPGAPEGGVVRGRKRKKAGKTLKSMISGSFWGKAPKTSMYLLLLSFLGLLYIGYGFHIHDLYMNREDLQDEVRQLRSKSQAVTAVKMDITRRSRILEELARRGIPLHESLTPNRVIGADRQEGDSILTLNTGEVW